MKPIPTRLVSSTLISKTTGCGKFGFLLHLLNARFFHFVFSHRNMQSIISRVFQFAHLQCRPDRARPVDPLLSATRISEGGANLQESLRSFREW